MTNRGAMKTGTVPGEETPEQAARAISAALDFLQVEANAIGMIDVSELIGRARTKADEAVANAFSQSRM